MTETIAPPRTAQLVDGVAKQLYIGGTWRGSSSGATFTVSDPATEDALCDVADATAADAMAALDAAAGAQEQWAATAPNDRAMILWRAFERLTERAEDFATLMTLEMGKPLAEARAEVAYAADFFRWFAGEAARINGQYKQNGNGAGRLLVMRQPVGPTLMITPWNFPLAMGTRKIGPAIAAGCTIVMKPAELTPLSMLALTQLLQECGLPPGVLNVITTSSPGAATGPLIADRRLRKLTFTGSTAVGRKLIEAAARNVLKVSMELGGNAPFIVFEDADLDAAVEGALLAKMRNIGEACTAANRFYIAESVAEEFSQRLAHRMGAMTMGPGLRDDVQVGPLIDGAARQKVHSLVEDAVAKGATVMVGGDVPAGRGFFYPPTVLRDVPDDARVFNEEIFGPVAPLTTFGSEEEAIARANDTEYGLVGYLFTRDLKRALRVSEALETGMIGLNQGVVSNAGAPFGGVKQSGLGREGGDEGIEDFLEPKYVAISL